MSSRPIDIALVVTTQRLGVPQGCAGSARICRGLLVKIEEPNLSCGNETFGRHGRNQAAVLQSPISFDEPIRVLLPHGIGN